MKYSAAAWLLLVSLCTGLPGMVQAEAAQQNIVVTGEAIVNAGDRPAARQRALEEAFSAALTQVLGAYISAESFTRNFESIERSVFGKTQGYIKRYEILNENVSDDLLQLQARVTVSTENIKDDLTALGILLDALGNPLLFVEGREEGMSTPISVERFKGLLAGKGFQIADNAEAEPDLLIQLSGRVQNRNQLPGVGLSGAIVSLQAKALRTTTDRIVLETAKASNGAGLNDAAALTDAYGNAADALFPEFLEELVRQWQQEINNGRLLHLKGQVDSFQVLQTFKRRLGRIFGVNKVDLKGYRDGQAEMLVRFRGTMFLLAELIGRTDFSELSARITGIDESNMSLTIEQLLAAE